MKVNRFPNLSELQFLVGKELSGITFGCGSVFFRWWEGGGIRAFYDFEHIDEEGDTHKFQIQMSSDGPSFLHRLIQHKVAAIEVRSTTLQLTFDGGQMLVFHACTKMAENGLIQFGDQLENDYIIY